MSKKATSKAGITKPVVIIIILVIVVLTGAALWYFLGKSGNTNQGTKNTNTNAAAANTNAALNLNNSGSTAQAADPRLVGTWTSDCLVPDENSPWSERHQFVINADGTAVHTRWSSDDHSCSPTDTLVNNYQYTIPSSGQINLTDQESGDTMYDIYQISDDTLLFGHGFQAHYPTGYDATQGLSASNRFHVLNSYIVYHKQ